MSLTRSTHRLTARFSLPSGDMESELSAFSSSFSLNRIPTGSLVLPLGRDTRSLLAAPAHEISREGAGNLIPVEVWLHPAGQWASYKHIDGDDRQRGLWDQAGSQVIFRGYVSNLNYRRLVGQIQLQAQLIHWLSDLSAGSIFSEVSHPTNPSDYIFRAAYAPESSAGSSLSGDFIGFTRYSNTLSPANISKDLWGDAIAPMLCDITGQSVPALGQDCFALPISNENAAKALARIEGGHSCAENPNRWSVPLSLDNLGTYSEVVAKAIRQYINRQTVQAWWTSTIWDKLVSDFGPNFLFSIVPRVETAICIPFVPGLRDTYSVALEAEDLSLLGASSIRRRPIRAMGIYAPIEAATASTDPHSQNAHRTMGLGGCFMPDPTSNGMVMIRSAPSWLNFVPALAASASRSLGGRSSSGQGGPELNTSTTPLSDEGGGSTSGQPTAAQAVLATAHLYDALAKYLFLQENLRGSSAQVSTNFRFDIAPGSNIFIRHGRELFLDAQEQTSMDLVAAVTRVAHSVQANPPMASTSFELAYIRTAEQNENDRFSTDQHPLYTKSTFLGAPLVDEYLFDP